MILSAIVAVSDNGVIGNKGSIPWRIPGEQARVKQITMGHPLIMGRKTHEAIGRSLPGRLNVVISRDPNYKTAPEAVAVRSLDEALAKNEVANADEAFIFGGQAIYDAAMTKLDRLYITCVHLNARGDAFFKYDPAQWREVFREEHKKDEHNPHDYDFITLERR